MKIMRMRAIPGTFCIILFIAIFTTGSSDNSLTEGKIFQHACSEEELSLNVSSSIIREIGKNFISSPLIKCLNLEGNQIQSVTEGAFDGVPSLEYLNIAGNMINNLMSFGGHENLKTLILANQSVYNQGTLKIFGKYPELYYLDLSGNKIRSINLETEVNNNYWDNVQRMYLWSFNDKFPKLQYLDLSHNRMYSMFIRNDDMSHNSNLMYLFLHDNDLNDLNIKYLQNLIIVTVDKNNIQTLEKHYCNDYSICVGSMPKLKYLSISRNQLHRIDHDFFEFMPELTKLNLSRNRLDNIYGVFHNLISLEDLDLDNNLLSNISFFDTPSQLSSLSLNRNKIEYIDSEDLINTPNLRKLYLNNNIIKNIHKNAFQSLELLEELHLANNVLIHLPTEWSNNLKSLRYLNLANNKFMYLEFLSLSDTLPLIHIDLIDNPIISFSSKILHDLPENVTMYLSHDQRKIELDPSV